MVIYGIHPVLEALEASPQRVFRILVTKGRSNPRLQRVIDRARVLGIPVRFQASGRLEKAVGTTRHQDVAAELAPVRLFTLDEVLEVEPNLVLVVDGVEDPRNLGALLRTAEAAGVGAVLLPERRNCGITAAVVKSSAGATHHLRLCRIGNVARALERLKAQGLWVIGLDPTGSSEWEAIDLTLPLAVVVGGEQRGIRRLVREKCDFLVALPMLGKVESLNLSVAAGVILYQIVFGRRS